MTLLVLFNGLWQGALFAVAGCAASRAMPKRDAVTRSALWLTTLIAIAVIPVLTTLVHAPLTLHQLAASDAYHGRISINLLSLSTQAADRGIRLTAIVPWLITLWLACAGCNLFRLLRGYVDLASLAARARPFTGKEVARDVYISQEIEVPLVVGIAAPRVLIPSSMFETLDGADLQRVVAHERAHVRRNDPWCNLFVRVVEAVLFFNPSVRFVGRRLAEEREAACDDVAIAQVGQSFDYAVCLAAIAQMRPRRVDVLSRTALGFRTSLLSRIERLHSAQPPITSINRKTLGGIVMLFAIIALALQAFTPALARTAPTAADDQAPHATFLAANCAQSNMEAGVVTPQAPNLPHLHASGSAQAIVTIAPSGRVAQARIFRSSGNAAIDAAVVSAARRSTYRAKVVNCVPVQGTYIFKVDFRP